MRKRRPILKGLSLLKTTAEQGNIAFLLLSGNNKCSLAWFAEEVGTFGCFGSEGGNRPTTAVRGFQLNDCSAANAAEIFLKRYCSEYDVRLNLTALTYYAD